MENDSGENENDKRVFVSMFVEAYDKYLPGFQQKAADASKWGLAALLTVNGGAILGVINAGSRFPRPLLTCATFLAGMIFAIMSAALIRYDIEASTSEIDRLNGSARRALAGLDDIDVAYAAIHKRFAEEKTRWEALRQHAPTIAEVCSGAAFVIAAIVAAVSIDPGAAANARRCMALQSDFLSARPMRADSRDTFVALQCRPQGEGNVYVAVGKIKH